jgi:hypothetical protein
MEAWAGDGNTFLMGFRYLEGSWKYYFEKCY